MRYLCRTEDEQCYEEMRERARRREKKNLENSLCVNDRQCLVMVRSARSPSTISIERRVKRKCDADVWKSGSEHKRARQTSAKRASLFLASLRDEMNSFACSVPLQVQIEPSIL